MAKKKSKRKKAAKRHLPRDDFFVGVSNPNQIKVNFLESKKNVLFSMRTFQELKAIRKEKIEKKKQLRKNIRLLNSSLNTIMNELPHVTIPEEKVPEQPKIVHPTQAPPQTQVQQATPPPQPKPRKTTIDHIEDQLAEIEQKLSSLQ